MTITIHYFGNIAEVTQQKKESFHLEEEPIFIKDLQSKLELRYPELKQHIYVFAVNQTLINGAIALQENDEIALLPPFAGG